MAYDKIVDSAVLDAGLTKVADAIRGKLGVNLAARKNLTFPSGYASKITGTSTKEMVINGLTDWGGNVIVLGTLPAGTYTLYLSGTLWRDQIRIICQIPIPEIGVTNENSYYSKPTILGGGGYFMDIALANFPITFTLTAETKLAMAPPWDEKYTDESKITNLKLETGHLATTWTPAPEDEGFTFPDEMSEKVKEITTWQEMVEERLTALGLLRYTIPDGTTKITASEPFSYNANYYLDKIPNSVTTIAGSAFLGNANLYATELPEGLTEINAYTFSYCSNLRLKKLPEKITSIGKCAFQNCSGLFLTELPSGITTIGESAFAHCSNMLLTELPEGLTKIERYCFAYCCNLKLTKLPAGITEIGNYGLGGCTNMQLTELPSMLTTIGDYAFYYCYGGIKNIKKIPASVQTIGKEAFRNAELTELTFEGTPQSIAADAFFGCIKLTKINVPWAEGAVANVPWGATNATITYDYVAG